MKKLFTIASLLLLSTQAFAGGSVDLRADYVRNQYKVDDTTLVKSSNFYMNRFVLNYNGNFNEAVSYDVRANANGNFTLEHAEATHKFGDFSLTAGLLSNMMSSAFLGQTNPGDIYTAPNNSDSQIYPALAYWFSHPKGIHLDYVVGAHKIAAYVFDSDDTIVPRQGLGVGYSGSFMDKAFGLMASYHTAPKAMALDGSNRDINYMSLGVNYKLRDLYAELDYMSNVEVKNGSAGGDIKTSSIFLSAKYALGSIVPLISYESSVKSDVGDVKLAQLALGAEFRPKADENFRYHAVLINRTDTPVSGSSSNNQVFLVGMKILADIMK